MRWTEDTYSYVVSLLGGFAVFRLDATTTYSKEKKRKTEKSYSKDSHHRGGKFICWLEQVGGVSYDTSRAVYAEVLRSYLFGKVVPLCS